MQNYNKEAIRKSNILVWIFIPGKNSSQKILPFLKNFFLIVPKFSYLQFQIRFGGIVEKYYKVYVYESVDNGSKS